MQNANQFLKSVLNYAGKKADEAEVFQLTTGNMSVGFRNGMLREMDESKNTGICVRLIKNGQISMASTTNLDRIEETVDDAARMLSFGEAVTFSFPAPAAMPELDLASAEQQQDELMQMTEKARFIAAAIKGYDSQIVASSQIIRDLTDVRIMNTHGVDYHYQRNGYAAGGIGVLTEGRNILTCYKYIMGQSIPGDVEDLSDRIIELIRMGRTNIPFKSTVIPVLFSENALSDLLAALSAGLSGSAVSRGISPLTGKLDEQILDPGVSIWDDSLYPGATGTQPVDDEGVIGRRTDIIKNGVLKNYLMDLKASSELELEPTGNGFRYTSLIRKRSYTASPGPSFTNLFFSPGKRHHREILNDLDRVLFIDQLSGVLLGNLINGDWSGNIEYGILYENGVPRGRVKNAMTSGNFYTMFKERYLESSSDTTWISGFGGSSGSSSLPHVLIDKMNISAEN